MSKKRSFALAARPGFLIRRLHQIHLSLFAEECGAFDVTLVRRRQGARDRRLKHVRPTASCGLLLARMGAPARRAHERTINPLGRRDRALFMKALTQLVSAGNAHGRAPLRIG